MGNQMMRGNDEVKLLVENSADFNTMKDNPSLLTVWFAFDYFTVMEIWTNTQ